MLEACRSLACVDDGRQHRARGAASQQGVRGELSDKQKIARFKRNDTWASLLGDSLGEDRTGNRYHRQGRHLRICVVRSLCARGESSECGTASQQIPDPSLCRTPKEARRYACSKCGSLFTRSSSLRRHGGIHSGQRLHTREECGRAFSRPSYLRTRGKMHSGEESYTCKLCGRRVLHSSSLTKHRRTPKGEKPYACQRCGKTYSCPKSFPVRVITHSGEKPYACQRCGKTYCWLSSFQRHVKVHGGARPSKCGECGKVLSWPSSLHKSMPGSKTGGPSAGPRSSRTGGSQNGKKLRKGEERAAAFGWAAQDAVNVSDVREAPAGLHPSENVMQFVEKPYKCGRCGEDFSFKGM